MPENTRILVVDDDPEMRSYLKDLLTASGYQVSSAEDGDAAFDLVERTPGGFALVITDICMERMDGHELAAQIQVVSPATPVLLTSAYVEESDPAMLKAHFLPKPFSPEQLLARVAELTA